MERVRQWLKLDELFEKERQIRTAMAQRAGLLPLILHSTFNHELMQQQYAGQAGVSTTQSWPPLGSQFFPQIGFFIASFSAISGFLTFYVATVHSVIGGRGIV